MIGVGLVEDVIKFWAVEVVVESGWEDAKIGNIDERGRLT